MRRLVLIFGVLVLCGMSVAGKLPAFAADNASAKSATVAVVDIQRILREAAATKMIRPQLDKLKQTYQKKFKQYEDDLRAENQALQQQRAILSPEAYAERQKAFKNRVNGMQREVQTVRRQLDQAGSAALTTVRRAFHQVTTELAKERSLQLIVRKSGLLYYDPNYDLTDVILKRLDKRLPEVVVDFQKPPRSDGADRSKKN